MSQQYLRLARIQKLGKRELTEKIRDVAGLSQTEADRVVQAFSLAVGIWMESMIRSIPEGTCAELLLSNLGVLQVSFGINFKPGSGNRTRRRLGLPLVPKLEVEFRPCEELQDYICRTNRQARISRNSKLPRGRSIDVVTNPPLQVPLGQNGPPGF